MFSIVTNQLVRWGVISVENVSLEDLVGYHFPLWIGMFSPLLYLLDVEGEWGVREAVKADKGEEGGGGQLRARLLNTL